MHKTTTHIRHIPHQTYPTWSLLLTPDPRSRSSYDRAAHNLADDDCQGTVCPAGHMCRLRTFMREHACDMCDAIITKGTSCSTCDFDLCHNCAVPARFTYILVSPTEPAATIPITVESESTAAPLPPVLSEVPTSPGCADTILVSSTSPPQHRTHPFFEARRSLPPLVADDAQPTFHAVPALLPPSASAPNPVDSAAPVLDTDVIPRMSRLKLKKPAAAAALTDPPALAEAAPALAQTPEVPASTAIVRSLVSSIIVILATVDARTRDLLKAELIASLLP